MAQSNYYDSALNGFQSRVSEKYNEAELRELDNGVLSVGLKNTDYIMDAKNVSKVKESVNRPVNTYVKMRKASTNGTGMTAFNTGIGGTSATQVITWVPFTEEFYFNETTGMDNVYDKYELFDNEMSQAQRNIRERVRVWLTNNIYTNRTGYNPGGINNASFNAATNAWEISGAQLQNPWSAMSSVMRQNKYGYSKYDIMADSILYPNSFEFQQAQATQNATNLAYQFDKKSVPPQGGGYIGNVWEDIILGNASEVPYVAPGYTNGAAIVMPSNSFGFIPWMPKLYTDGSGNFEDYAGGYGIVQDMTNAGLEYMVHGWRTQADTTAASGHGFTQDSVTQWQVGIYLAYVTTYLSNANETPNYFFALKP
jgi:hypothetical protein